MCTRLALHYTACAQYLTPDDSTTRPGAIEQVLNLWNGMESFVFGSCYAWEVSIGCPCETVETHHQVTEIYREQKSPHNVLIRLDGREQSHPPHSIPAYRRVRFALLFESLVRIEDKPDKRKIHPRTAPLRVKWVNDPASIKSPMSAAMSEHDRVVTETQETYSRRWMEEQRI